MTEILLHSDGTFHSDVIEAHVRAFTLDYLRHSVLGVPRQLNSEPIQGPAILAPDPVVILSPHDEKLLVEPNADELKQYSPKKEATSTPLALQDESFLLKRFTKHLNRAHAGFFKSELEMMRSAIGMQMDRVLSSVASDDVDGFNQAYGDFEQSLTATMKTLLGELKAAGMPGHEATQALTDLAETSVRGAIDTHIGRLESQKEKTSLFNRYEDLLHDYKEQQRNFAKAVEEQRKKVKPTARIQRYFIPHHPSLTRHTVRLKERDLLTGKGEGCMNYPDNDNERTR